MIKIYHTAKNGFTLVETLVATGILTIAILAAFAAVRTGVSTASLSKQQITAFYLAQEAVEQVRNIRDGNALNVNSTSWLQGISANASDPCFFGKTCYVDTLNSGGVYLQACTGDSSTCPNLSVSPAGAYGYLAGWTPTSFKRWVTLTSVNAHEVTLNVTVTWSRGVLTQTFAVSENLMDWQ
jgi:prepilin-type N-terminal cleavage/methylation domain-containing protein